MARVHVHPGTTRMVASVKQSATRAFVAVLALLAKSYEVVLAALVFPKPRDVVFHARVSAVSLAVSWTLLREAS